MQLYGKMFEKLKEINNVDKKINPEMKNLKRQIEQ